MKQKWKKLIGLVLIGICVLAMTACGSSKTEEGSLRLPDEATQQSLIDSFGSVLQNISQLDDASIKSYLESDDAFSASAATAWDSNGKNLGAYVETVSGEMKVNEDTYLVTLQGKFEKRTAECVFTLDKNGNPTGVSIDPVYTMGEKMTQAAQNTVMGVAIVFVMLVFLSFIISLMKYIPGLVESFGRKKAAPVEEKPAPAPIQAAPVQEEEELVDDGELVAVIAAAIATCENTSADGFVVRSIRKSKKGNWQRA
ncbi:MAG: OadG family transporter subunit [Blautia sp.]